MAKQIFRKVALERISSPEQLDQLITITTPLGWLSLLATMIFLAGIIFWGVYGSIPTQVQGQGILLKKEGITSIRAENAGRITKINVEAGDSVGKGQIVARLEQDDLLERIRKAQLELNNLETSFEEKKKTDKEAKSIRLQELQQREMNQHQHIKNLETQINAQHALEEQKQKLKKGIEKLVKEGIITNTKLLEVENEIVRIQQNINTLRLDIERAKNQFKTIVLEIKKIESTETIDELTHSQQVEKLQLEIRTLQATFAENSQVVSPYKGSIVEIPQKEGDLVRSGTVMVLMERAGENPELEVIAYFSPFIGKQIQKTMKVQIAPSIVKREEYGSLEGIVSKVDKYPSTFATVMKTLQNETLARMLVLDAAPIEIRANLLPDTETVSGYKWSSGSGPPIGIDSGTICFITVTVKEQAPITLVIPLLKKYILGEGK